MYWKKLAKEIKFEEGVKLSSYKEVLDYVEGMTIHPTYLKSVDKISFTVYTKKFIYLSKGDYFQVIQRNPTDYEQTILKETRRKT